MNFVSIFLRHLSIIFGRFCFCRWSLPPRVHVTCRQVRVSFTRNRLIRSSFGHVTYQHLDIQTGYPPFVEGDKSSCRLRRDILHHRVLLISCIAVVVLHSSSFSVLYLLLATIGVLSRQIRLWSAVSNHHSWHWQPCS